MSGPFSRTYPFRDVSTPTPTVDHTDARFIKLGYTHNSAILTQDGHPNAWPSLVFATAVPSVTAEIATIPGDAGGGRVVRTYGNAVVDDLMNLQTLDTSSKYKCKFFAIRITRDIATTTIANPAERIFQYGDGGSSALLPCGGWVARINSSTYTLTFAKHAPYNGLPKGSANPNHPDISVSSAPISVANWLSGQTIFMAVDNTTAFHTLHIFRNGVWEASVSSNANGMLWPLSGPSNVPPPTDTTEAGLSLFNTSRNSVATPLKSATVTPIWIGEAMDFAHLTRLAAAHHANPLANPYV